MDPFYRIFSYEMSLTLVQQVNDVVIIYNFYHYEFVSNDRSLPEQIYY